MRFIMICIVICSTVLPYAKQDTYPYLEPLVCVQQFEGEAVPIARTMFVVATSYPYEQPALG